MIGEVPGGGAQHREDSATRVRNRHATALCLGLVLVVTVVAYLPALQAELTNWDDPAYVTRNPLIQELSGENLRRMWSELYWASYTPLTLLSYATEHALAGDSAWLYHLDNLLLHLATTALVLWWVLLLDGRRGVATVTALLFGVHTLHVESVAWVSGRKDVLFGLFFFASLLAYQRYLRRPGQRPYLASVVLFLLSLLAKGTAVSLTVTLVAVDAVMGRRLTSRKVLLEKLPFLALSLLFGVIAVIGQATPGGIANSLGTRLFTLPERLLLACYGLGQYLLKLVLPVNLSAFYPYPEKTGGSLAGQFWLYPLALIALALLLVPLLRRHSKVCFGLAFFLINIALVLQVLPYGNFVMADRYTYVASLGWFLAVAALLAALARKGRSWRYGLTVFLAAYVGLLAGLTWQRCHVWRDSITLWDDVLARHAEVWEAWDNRGSARVEIGDLEGAVADHTRAIEIEPRFGGAFFNRANAKVRLGDYSGAIADYNAAILLRPDSRDAIRNREIARQLLAGSDTARAEPESGPAVPAGPVDAAALARAVQAYDAGDHRGAIARLDALVQAGSGGAPAHLTRGLAYFQLGNIPAALADLDAALRLDPTLAPARAYRAAIRLLLGDNPGAIEDCTRAIELDPELVDAWITRGAAHHNLGQHHQALADLDQAIRLDAANPKARFNRGMARVLAGDRGSGCADLQQALRMGSPEAGAALARHCGQGAAE